jgi:cytochrome c peroxidase
VISYVGNCISCHPAPLFTDRQFHNNGVAQIEYDALFGAGAFAALYVPDLEERADAADQYLPPSAQHPDRVGRFRSIPDKRRPYQADLGLWNVYGNPDMPGSQRVMSSMICERLLLTPAQCVPERVLPATIGLFKTATVRDLGQSNPYFHNGALGTLEDVIDHYVQVSSMMRKKRLRNGAQQLADIRVDAGAIDPLVAFLRSLDEDYH